jgi:nucleoside 2-deoxyribosyltransferase
VHVGAPAWGLEGNDAPGEPRIVALKELGPRAEATLKRLHSEKPKWFHDALCNAAWRITRGSGSIQLTEELLETLRDAKFAPLFEQANNLILFIGEQGGDPAVPVSKENSEWANIVGASPPGVLYLFEVCESMGWIQYNIGSAGKDEVRLTFEGWHRFDNLQRMQVQSRIGFMAMQFNVAEINVAYEQCFKKAAEDAGFGLRILTEGQGAGLIDDQLRVAIRAAKFLVADVSTGNRGAYWEAGFAEGLGRPVIYTCKEEVFNDRNHQHHPHFDTNHMNTVLWTPNNFHQARRRLTATLRNTFPTEAPMPIE